MSFPLPNKYNFIMKYLLTTIYHGLKKINDYSINHNFFIFIM